MTNLIFAPLIRVSTEKQERQGESLHTQRKQLENAIQSLGGNVYQWYAGQEHATPENERQILERLIQDAKAHKFNAIMVADATRWSRDNGKSKDYLEILRKNNIRFFVRGEEMNLFLPLHIFILGMSVEVGEFFGREQAYKSIINRIERAKKGYPSCGKFPYGRTFDKDACTWAVIPKIKAQVEEMADLYLHKNFTFDQLSKKYHIQPTYIHKILTKRSGDKWEQRFRNKSCGIDETVETTIPRLLPDDVIEAIKAKCQTRKIVDHGAYKHKYLLARFIFDAETGYALTGTPSGGGQLYYRTFKKGEHQYQVKADLLENAVQDATFEALSDNDALFKAVFDGEVEQNLEDELRKKRSQLQKELATVQTKLSRFGDAIGEYEGDMKTFLNNLKPKIQKAEKRLNELENEINLIDAQLQCIPTKREIQGAREKMRQGLQKSLEMSSFMTGHTLRSLPFDDKRALLKLLFAGKDEYGKKYGIYVTLISDNPKKFSFTAYGRLGNVQGYVTKDEYISDSSDVYEGNNDTVTDGIAHIINDVDIIDKSICMSSMQ
jgi:DNA invertase Pin-like site-specific DNA recombinase